MQEKLFTSESLIFIYLHLEIGKTKNHRHFCCVRFSITLLCTNRVQKQHLQLTHKRSRIECCLLFDNDVNVIKAAKIISDVITLKPICM